MPAPRKPRPIYVRKDRRDFDFTKAPIYRKTATLRYAQVEIAQKAQRVVTRIKGRQETRNRAAPGDRIVTGPLGERYVIGARKFVELYKRDAARRRFISKARVQALKLREDVELLAPWGELQRTRKGGFVVRRVGKARDVYLIEQTAFRQTYRRERAAPPARTGAKSAGKRRALARG